MIRVFFKCIFFVGYNGVILIREVFINIFIYFLLILNLYVDDSKYCRYFFRIGIVIFVVVVRIEDY